MINEWENEPDYLRFKEDTTGWECIIKRTKALGILRYIEISGANAR